MPRAGRRPCTARLIRATAASRVDRITEAAGAAGGNADINPKQDLGSMYSRSFEDVDGHIREVLHMDMPQFSAEG